MNKSNIENKFTTIEDIVLLQDKFSMLIYAVNDPHLT